MDYKKRMGGMMNKAGRIGAIGKAVGAAGAGAMKGRLSPKKGAGAAAAVGRGALKAGVKPTFPNAKGMKKQNVGGGLMGRLFGGGMKGKELPLPVSRANNAFMRPGLQRKLPRGTRELLNPKG